LELLENCLVEGGIGAVRIRDVPIFHLVGIVEGDVANAAAEIDDQIDFVPRLVGNGLGRQANGGITVAQKRFLSFLGDFAERIEASAGGFQHVRGFALGNGFGHGTAAGVTKADEKDAEFFSGHEQSWN
jgi:hypothetical protein